MNLVRDRVTTFASDRLVDLTGVTHVALRDGLRSGDEALRNQVVRRESKRDIENALNFAYGLDPSGRRLPLVSDHLPIGQLRRAVVARERHDPRVAAVYARADRFDDGQPNVRLLTDQSVVNAKHDRTPSSHPKRASRAVPTSPTRNELSGSGSRSTAPSTSSPASAKSARFAASASQRSTVSGRSSGSAVLSGSKPNRSPRESQLEIVAGATALQVDVARVELPQTNLRANLSVVRRHRRSGGQIAVISFWTTFVVVMMFTAVVMWAQNTTGSVELENINKTLAEEEGTYTQLRVEVARLQSPQRIEVQATRLGLSAPENITFVDPNNAAGANNAGSTATSR